MTEKRRHQVLEARRRYNASAKGRATTARYRASAKGKASEARCNATLLRAGRTYLGHAATPALGCAVNAYIKERVCDFKARQREA
jgi:hypothetical protein